MPKKLIEINKFTGGIVSTPSATDIDEQAAKYSSNIDPITADGRLQGVDKDKILTKDGFKSNVSDIIGDSGVTPLEDFVDMSEFITVRDKTNRNSTNLVGITPDTNNNSISKISIIEDIHSTVNSNIQVNTLLEGTLGGLNGEHHLTAENNQVFIGLGGNKEGNSKVVMNPSENGIINADTSAVGAFDSKLIPPDEGTISGMFSEFMTFSMHGTNVDTALSYDDVDTPNAKIYADYDFAVTINNGVTLYDTIRTGVLANIVAGQTFKCANTVDTSDTALVDWKKYDYNKNISAIVADDIFMYCGDTSDGVPVLRFLGNLEAQGGTPAFMYAIKKDSSVLYKISLTETADGTAFGSVSIAVQGATESITITTESSRISQLDLADLDGWDSNYISAFSACHSPPLWNAINLVGGLTDQHAIDNDTYYNNGHIKILYRHGVFYIGGYDKSKILFRLNAIDYHALTTNTPEIDALTLDFSKIPSQLHAEGGEGIIRRTIEDQDVTDNSESRNAAYDPGERAWSNSPTNAYILGICETFECGKITNIENKISQFTTPSAWKFTTKNQSRLTTGDKVRFSGLLNDNNTSPSTGESYHDAFNVSTPWEVSVVDDGDAFYINAGTSAGTKTPALGPGDSMWWNSKVWVLYGKRNFDTSFNDWDLFLYNANTNDVSEARVVYMADRTPPYHQARYYQTEVVDNDESRAKLYYPGQFAFIKGDRTPGYASSTSKLEDTELSLPTSDVTASSDSPTSGNLCEFGIYDKAGRWACNGVQRVESQTSNTDQNDSLSKPIDWVGGEDGPESWYKVGTGLYGILNGHLCFGQNIGWDIDNGRAVYPTNNSLHPVIPYSSLYNGSLHYTGYNSTNITNPFDDSWNNSDLYKNNNRPKHAVTFLGKVDGKFVVQPALMRRDIQNSSESSNSAYGSGNQMDRGFAVYDSSNSNSKTKEYSKEQTLFTIDDFSGHRGSVYAVDDNSLDFTRPVVVEDLNNPREYEAGIERGRPNWGGPEIENPLYIATTSVKDSRQVGSHSSVNGGLYDENDRTATDKGWDGYTPPYLFTPGSGYYVYINRAWKSMSNYQPDAASDRNSHLKCPVWGFQTEGMRESDRIATSNNRWNNFSSTALSDNFSSHSEASDASTNRWQQPWQTSSGDANYTDKYLNTRFFTANRNLDTDFANGSAQDTHRTRRHYRSIPSFAQSICTMHKLAIDDMGEINSIFPVILESNIATNSTSDADFHVAYLCGTNRNNSTSIGTGLLLFRTNFDYIWDKEADNKTFGSNVANTDYFGPFYSHKLFTNIASGFYTNPNDNIGGDGPTGLYPILTRGTHYAEIIDITNETTRYRPGVSEGVGALVFRQAALDTYNNDLTGDNLVLSSKRPWIPLAGHAVGDGNFHVWLQVNAKTSTDIYFGQQDDVFARDDNASDSDPVNYDEDSGGTFFVSNDGNFFSGDGDGDIETELNGFLAFSNPSATSNGILEPGDYYYKLGFEYDNQFESPLIKIPLVHTLAASASRYAYIEVKIGIPGSIITNFNKRITGLTLYRKFEGGDEDEYHQVDVVKFTDNWVYNSDTENWTFTIFDRDNTNGTYSGINGIDQEVEDTSINYGLSTILHGYMYVTKAWHPEVDDVRRYIYKSQPNNFFAFDWTSDFVIMPEEPIAMVDFNSRLYVWGKNSLYKIDPHSLLIEDEYKGISIIGKDAHVKTEFGLCFMDENNVYIHDGNKPTPIAGPILYSSNDILNYKSTSGSQVNYTKPQQGYRELVKQTITNGNNPNIFYSGLKNSFLIYLSDSDLNGRVLSYNITRARWDSWESPRPSSVGSSLNSQILVNDGTYLWNYLKDESSEFTTYKRREWEWFSKDISFGLDTQDKLFRNISFIGTPSVFDFTSNTPQLYGDSSSTDVLSVQAFVDGEPKSLTIQNKFYNTINLANTIGFSSLTDTDITFSIMTLINPTEVSSSVNLDGTQAFIRPGHYIKIDDEIMFVYSLYSATGTEDTYTLYVRRAQMGTTAASHTSGYTNFVSIVSPLFKFPSGVKGKSLSVRLLKQRGYIDSIGIVYRPKSIK